MRTLEVRYHGGAGPPRVLGRLAAVREGIYFEYAADAIATGLDLSPVKLRPAPGVIRGSAEPFGGLHGLFNDSLPDGFGAMLVDRWIQRQGGDPRAASALDRLAIIGSRAMGALSYHPETGPSASAVEWNLAAAEAELGRVAEGGSSTIIPELLLAGGSPQGARPKLLLLLSEDGRRAISGSHEIPVGYVASLVKFPVSKLSDTESRLEEAYARMARAAGVRMPATRLIDAGNGRVAFAAERFDRKGAQRIHMHSAAGLLEVDHRAPSLDYDSLLRLARLLARSQPEVEAMYRLAVFNVLGHNRDDHAKNFAFLRDAAGSWSVAPGFDLTFSMGPGGEHTTSVLGRGRDITAETLSALGVGASIPASTCSRIIDQVRSALATFPRIASELDVPRARANEIARALGVATAVKKNGARRRRSGFSG
jgi:serine/threonine-protein kinase HipA